VRRTCLSLCSSPSPRPKRTWVSFYQMLSLNIDPYHIMGFRGAELPPLCLLPCHLQPSPHQIMKSPWGLCWIWGDHVWYKSLIQCAYCDKVFRTKDLVRRHFDLKHKFKNGVATKRQFDYKTIPVNGSYIKRRLNNCRTKRVTFGHVNPELGCSHKKEWLNSCYLRICPKCVSTRKSRYLKRYSSVLKHFKRISLLTLTYRGYHPLNSKVKKNLEYCLKLFFKNLKYHYPNYVFQYIRVLELVAKPNNTYYYHYHFLIDAPYIHQAHLSEIWGKLTGSPVVHIKYVGNRWSLQHKKNYICKYLAKPQQNISYEKYALHVYREHYVQTSTSLVITAIVEQKMDGHICEKCGNRLYFVYETDLTLFTDKGGGQKCL
jgi:hypothetical protein